MARSSNKHLRSVIRRWPVIPVVLILLFSWTAWYVGIRTKELPTQVHSIGVVARVTGGDSIVGVNVTAGSHARRVYPARRSCATTQAQGCA